MPLFEEDNYWAIAQNQKLYYRCQQLYQWNFYFHLANYKDKESREAYLWKLNKIFEDALLNPKSIIIIDDTSIKNNVTSLIFYVHSNLNFVTKTVYHTIKVTTTEIKLFAIRYGINQAIQISDISHIIVITDIIHLVRQIFDSSIHLYQLQSIVIAQDFGEFFNKNT